MAIKKNNECKVLRSTEFVKNGALRPPGTFTGHPKIHLTFSLASTLLSGYMFRSSGFSIFTD